VSGTGDGPSLTIPALLQTAARRFGPGRAVEDGETRLTYAELLEEARTFGAALVESGIERGDRVAIWACNRVEWIVAVLGLSLAGAVLVPVNTRFKGREAADILLRSGARALVTVTDFLQTDYVAMLRASSTELPISRRSSWSAEAFRRDGVMGRIPRTGDRRRPSRGRSSRERSGKRRSLRHSLHLGDDGLPKGVVMSHGRTLRVATDWVEMTGLGVDDRYLMVNPYFHMFGLKAGILACVVSGATMIPEAVFDVDRALRRVEEEKVTVLPGSPTLYQAILDHPGRGGRDLSSLRVAVTGPPTSPSSSSGAWPTNCPSRRSSPATG